MCLSNKWHTKLPTIIINNESSTPYSSDLVELSTPFKTVNVSDQFTYGFQFKTTNINNIKITAVILPNTLVTGTSDTREFGIWQGGTIFK
jgi:hypothetical protein